MSNQKWKKIVETKVLPSIRSNRIIQKSDGKFFEKFGSLLKDLQERQKISNKDYGNKAIQSIVDPPTATSPIEMITTAVGWSINEPYSELLSEILHIVGTDVRVQPEALLEFLQEVFLVNWEYHSRMLEKVKKKVAPSIVLNVNVIEGKELPAKDINGSSDPFCVLYMSSSPQEQHKTEVQEETLSPKWQEHFTLPVQDPQEDTLHIEVYDFDPAESMLEKVNQIGKVKGIKGMKNFFRELTRKTPKGQEYIYELIGSIAIPLKSIPPNGETCWAKIQNETKATSKGQIRLAMAFGSEKNREMGIQEYRQLIKALVQYYLEKDQIEPYKWRGDFGLLAQTLMRQHVVQSNLTTTDKSLAEFVEFVSVHVNNQPLSFTVFTALLDTFVDTYTTFDENQMKSFWEFAERLLSSCLNIVKKLRQLNPTDEHAQTQLIAILSILSSLSQTADVNPLTDVGLQKDVHSMLKDVVSEGARDWFASIMDQNRPESQEDEAVLVNRVQIVLLVTTDLQIANEHHAKLFDEALKFPYAATLFQVYEPKVNNIEYEYFTFNTLTDVI
uniref:BAI1-associated protein 3 n=2 Tax=Cacopsylla melanoneura TaxID=428564 RepID=A0A8D8SPF7_9HEMI